MKKSDSSMMCLLRVDWLHYVTFFVYILLKHLLWTSKQSPWEQILLLACFEDSVEVVIHKMSKSFCIFLISSEQIKPSMFLEFLSPVWEPNEIREEFLKFCRKRHQTLVHPMPLGYPRLGHQFKKGGLV